MMMMMIANSIYSNVNILSNNHKQVLEVVVAQWLKLCIRVLAWTICLHLGTWTVWMSPCAPSILVHVCAAVQHARSLSPPTAMLASSAAIVCPLHLHHTAFLGPAQVQFYKGAKACILMNIDQPHWCLLNTLLASHIRSHSSEIAVHITSYLVHSSVINVALKHLHFTVLRG